MALPSLPGRCVSDPRERAVRDPNGCLIWQGGTDEDGYGKAFHGRAHRKVWEIENGPIPDGMMVCHSCDNPPCLEITHFFLGSNAENIADMDSKGRRHIRRGEKHHRSKLTEQDVRAIRESASSNQTIAAEFSINPVTVWKVRACKLWSHI